MGISYPGTAQGDYGFGFAISRRASRAKDCRGAACRSGDLNCHDTLSVSPKSCRGAKSLTVFPFFVQAVRIAKSCSLRVSKRRTGLQFGRKRSNFESFPC
jgi:hypothetical protein